MSIPNELQEKLKVCKTPEEAQAILNEENVTLTDEELDQVAGGVMIPPRECLNDLEHKKPGKPAQGSVSPSFRMI